LFIYLLIFLSFFAVVSNSATTAYIQKKFGGASSAFKKNVFVEWFEQLCAEKTKDGNFICCLFVCLFVCLLVCLVYLFYCFSFLLFVVRLSREMFLLNG
jgi:hypothetical protein